MTRATQRTALKRRSKRFALLPNRAFAARVREMDDEQQNRWRNP
jgi:hypothetical protein